MDRLSCTSADESAILLNCGGDDGGWSLCFLIF